MHKYQYVFLLFFFMNMHIQARDFSNALVQFTTSLNGLEKLLHQEIIVTPQEQERVIVEDVLQKAELIFSVNLGEFYENIKFQSTKASRGMTSFNSVQGADQQSVLASLQNIIRQALAVFFSSIAEQEGKIRNDWLLFLDSLQVSKNGKDSILRDYNALIKPYSIQLIAMLQGLEENLYNALKNNLQSGMEKIQGTGVNWEKQRDIQEAAERIAANQQIEDRARAMLLELQEVFDTKKKEFIDKALSVIRSNLETLDFDRLKDIAKKELNIMRKDLGYALFKEIERNNQGKIQSLMRYADLNILQHEKIVQGKTYGYSLLMAAAQSGLSNIVRQLINKGLPVNLQTLEGATALMFSAEKTFPETVAVLLEYGANATLQDSEGDTALIKALKRYPDNKKNFIKQGTAEEFDERFNQLADSLIKADANVNAQGYGKVTALMLAAGYGLKGIVQLLLANGADKTLKDIFGQTALQHAEKDPEIVKLLQNG